MWRSRFRIQDTWNIQKRRRLIWIELSHYPCVSLDFRVPTHSSISEIFHTTIEQCSHTNSHWSVEEEREDFSVITFKHPKWPIQCLFLSYQLCLYVLCYQNTAECSSPPSMRMKYLLQKAWLKMKREEKVHTQCQRFKLNMAHSLQLHLLIGQIRIIKRKVLTEKKWELWNETPLQDIFSEHKLMVIHRLKNSCVIWQLFFNLYCSFLKALKFHFTASFFLTHKLKYLIDTIQHLIKFSWLNGLLSLPKKVNFHLIQ